MRKVILFAIILLGCSISTVFSQEKKLWFRADKGINKHKGYVISWKDQVYNRRIAIQYAGSSRATFNRSSINFNPALYFDGINDFYSINSDSDIAYNNEDRCTFIVAKSDNTNTPWSTAFSYGKDLNLQSYGISSVGPTKRIGVSFTNENINISSWNDSYNLIALKYEFERLHMYKDHKWIFSTPSGDCILNTQKDQIVIGNQVGLNNNYWKGSIAEIIHYSGTWNNKSFREIDTYLAIKYGITLTSNYKINETRVYLLDEFTHDIFGIGTCFKYDLNQCVSTSQNTELTESSNIVIATTDDFVSKNGTNRTALMDDQFLMMGHNDGRTDAWLPDDKYSRVERLWKIQNTGNVGEVHLQINLSDYPKINNSIYKLVIDNDQDLSNGVVSVNELAGANDIYSCPLTFPSGESYMTVTKDAACPRPIGIFFN